MEEQMSEMIMDENCAMLSKRRSLLALVAAGAAATFLPGRNAAKAQEAGSSEGAALVGAWLASASRPTGQGVALLTFASDGTFFRSADNHPIQSVGHGVWLPVGEREFDASYIALRFDDSGTHIGSQKTRIRISVGPGMDQFTGMAKVSTLGLDGSVQGSSQTQLQGTRMSVEPFDA
jgi:hypothetical protein